MIQTAIMEVKQNFNKILISIFAVYIVLGLSMLAIGLEKVVPIDVTDELNTYIFLSSPVFLGLFIIPCIIGKQIKIELEGVKTVKLDYINVCLCLIALTLSIYRVAFSGEKLCIIVHTFIVAFSEEFLYRYFLLKDNRKYSMLIISSLIFAFILHNNEPIFMNLVLRFPMGLLFGYIFIRRNDLYTTTFLHFIYNTALL